MSDETPEKHGGVYSSLRTLIARKEIDRYRIDPRALNTPYYYRLPRSKKFTEQNYKHETACADLYATFVATGLVEKWERTEFSNIQLKPDRYMKADGINIYWEIDRGTETYGRIREKIEKYALLSKRTDSRFHVVFTTRDYGVNPLTGKTKQTAKSRASGIYEIFHDYGLDDRFLVALHEWVVNDPLERVFVSAEHPKGLMLGELRGTA